MSAVPITSCLDDRPQTRARLLAEARRGNREAFAVMVSPYLPALYRRARGFTGNTADAEDVSQEAMLKAWTRLGQFAGKHGESIDDFRAWISRIATNSSIDLLRQRRDGKIASLDEHKGQSEETLGSGIASEEQDPEERCARREMGRLLAKAILQLPPDLRQAGWEFPLWLCGCDCSARTAACVKNCRFRCSQMRGRGQPSGRNRNGQPAALFP